MENEKRIDKIQKLLSCSSISELAKKLNTHQPNVSRWRKKGFYPSTASLIDALLKVIATQKREINKLKRTIADLSKK